MSNAGIRYDEMTFYGTFYKDLQNARGLVLIQSPFLGKNRLDNIRPELANCIRRGVRICVFVRKPDEWERREFDVAAKTVEMLASGLRSIGVHVTLVEDIHEKYAVIDDRIVWRGSLNILSQIKSTEEMFRAEDAADARELVKTQGLDECVDCLAAGTNLLASGDLRQQTARAVREARLYLGLSQAQLAELSGLDQRTISQIENAERNLTLSKLNTLCDALHITPVFTPWYMKPTVKAYLDSHSMKPPLP